MRSWTKRIVRFHLAEYGMIVVLLLLCILFSWLTFTERYFDGAGAGKQVAGRIIQAGDPVDPVLIVARDVEADDAFVNSLSGELSAAGFSRVGTLRGQPSDLRRQLESIEADKQQLSFLAGNDTTVRWSVIEKLDAQFPELGSPLIIGPSSHRWPVFLTRDNLLNVAGQIAIIAIVAIGMTMVILTAGIDLSVGSLMAFSSIITTWCIRELAGGREAGSLALILCSIAGIAACGAAGAFSGLMITRFEIPPFIATLSMMLVASGLAFIVSDSRSIYQIPESFTWLSRGTSLGVPNAVLLMVVLYVMAHVVMTRTTLGRFIYAVGGNPEAAHLSGVPVNRILLTVYTICGALAGLGGVMLASKLNSGSATYAIGDELVVIAAVVVGGTSIFGGRGRIFGTLIGAFIIAVIQNGMNLVGIESNRQKVVLGAVILVAVLIDRLRAKILVRFDNAATENP